MNKNMFIVCVVIMGISVQGYAGTQEDLDYFDTYLAKNERHIATGAGLFWGGVAGAVLGETVVILGSFLQDNQTINNKEPYLIGGYTVLGIGVGTILAGIPLWLYGITHYHNTLERRNRYFLITNE